MPYPQNGWTLDQFLLIAQQLTRRERDEVIQRPLIGCLAVSP
jgi:hypothetical protein